MGFQRHFHGDNLIQLTATYTGAKQHILGQHILGLALPPLLQLKDASTNCTYLADDKWLLLMAKEQFSKYKRQLADKHVKVQDEWIEACIQWLTNETQVITRLTSSQL